MLKVRLLGEFSYELMFPDSLITINPSPKYIADITNHKSPDSIIFTSNKNLNNVRITSNSNTLVICDNKGTSKLSKLGFSNIKGLMFWHTFNFCGITLLAIPSILRRSGMSILFHYLDFTILITKSGIDERALENIYGMYSYIDLILINIPQKKKTYSPSFLDIFYSNSDYSIHNINHLCSALNPKVLVLSFNISKDNLVSENEENNLDKEEIINQVNKYSPRTETNALYLNEEYSYQ